MGLSFLSPLLLGGAALVAAPIILHMVMRRTPVPHAFPALRFLKERAIANRRRLQLSHLLLLLLRMAALVLLALALARPVLRGAGWLPNAEGPVAAALVFDTAPRMMLREGNKTRLEQAAEMARVLLGKLPGGSEVAVFDTAGSPAAFSPTLAAAEVRIDRLEASTPAVSLPAAMAAAKRLLETAELERRELYVFSDCSRGAWEKAPLADPPQPPAPAEGEAAEAAKDPGAAAMLVIDVSAAAARNLAVESLELSADRIAAGTPVVVTATVSRTGTEATRPLAVEIVDDAGRLVRRGIKPVEPRGGAAPASGEGGAVTVSFEVGGLPPGTRQGRLVLDGSDDLAADDVRSFTVEVGAPARVIVASARPASQTARFIVEAIAPAALRKAGTARFSPEPVDYESLDATDWETAAGIVLLDPPPLADRQWAALAEWLASGRGLVVWLGPAAAAGGFNTEGSRRVLGGELIRVWRTADAGNFLAPAGLDHPILAAFRRVGDAVPWQDFPIFKHWEFAPAEPPAAEGEAGDGPAAVVAAYRNGLPAILEHRVGQGTAVVVTTPVARDAGDPAAWNTLATGFEPWPFLILANETLLQAIASPDDRNVVAGGPATLHIGRRDLPTAVVRTPGGDTFPAAIDRTRGTVTVTATREPGNYSVRAGGEAEGVADGFSANLDPSATDFRRLSAEDLARVLGPEPRLARTEDELVRDVKLDRIGSELFGWLIVLAAVAMAADWIVANRFYKPRETADAERDAVAEFAESLATDADGEAVAEEVLDAAATPPGRPGPPPLPPVTGAPA